MENEKEKKEEELPWAIKMTVNKLADEIAKKEDIPLSKAKEKAKEIVTDHKRWTSEIIRNMFAYSLVDKEKISFRVAREKVEKWILESDERSKEITANIKIQAEKLAKEKNVTIDKAEKAIWNYIERMIIEQVAFE